MGGGGAIAATSRPTLGLWGAQRAPSALQGFAQLTAPADGTPKADRSFEATFGCVAPPYCRRFAASCHSKLRRVTPQEPPRVLRWEPPRGLAAACTKGLCGIALPLQVVYGGVEQHRGGQRLRTRLTATCSPDAKPVLIRYAQATRFSVCFLLSAFCFLLSAFCFMLCDCTHSKT